MNQPHIDEAAEVLWNYHRLGQPARPADVMLVLGSHDLRVAIYAAEILQSGIAPFAIVSGGVAHQNDLLKTGWTRSEAEEFAEIMKAEGVSEEKILMETQAKNTGENFDLSRTLLETRSLPFETVLVVTKPYMERRAFATGAKRWPDKKIFVTSPPLSFTEYMTGEISKEDVIHIMVGDLQRIDVYGQNGFQIPQEISLEVREAFEQLKSLGFTKHLLQNA